MTETEKIILEITNKAKRLEVQQSKRTFLLVLIIILAVAYMESESWRDFGLKIFLYGLIAEFTIILMSVFFGRE